ncbi:MAG: hypothetical protein E4G96_02990, partial [Chrysiogenales bacterium]
MKGTTRGGMKKKALIVAGASLALLAIVGAFNFNRLIRLYRVVTLFEPDTIEENFRRSGELFDSRIIPRSPRPFVFNRATAALPESYSFNGTTGSVASFIDRTDTTGLIVARDDTILFEKYYRGNTEQSKALGWSVTKSIVSALFGIAVAEGHISD